MKHYINKAGKIAWKGVIDSDILQEFHFDNVPFQFEDDIQFAFHSNLGSITVLNRMTGLGFRDIETGFRDPEDRFWLASGMVDARDMCGSPIGDVIKHIKLRANTCRPEEE